MKLSKLYKQLGALIEQGEGRAKVTIAIDSFHHPLDEVAIRDVEHAGIEMITLCDGDGFTLTTAKGRERQLRCLVLSGTKPRNAYE